MNGRLRLSPPVTAVIVLLWVAVILGIYFIGYERRGLLQAGLWLAVNSSSLLAVPPVFWSLMAGRIVDLATVGLLIASAWCIGLAVLRLTRWANRLDALTHLVSIAIGLGLWSWFVLIVGLSGHISRPIYLVASFLSLALLAWHWPFVRKSWTERGKRPSLGAMEKALIVFLALGVVLNIIPAFTPEVEYDTLEYHLGALKEYQKAGRIVFLPHNFYASMPSLTEMLYLWGITLRSSSVAKLIHGAFALMTAIGLITFGTRLGSRQLGLTAGALFYLLPFVTNLAETGRIDLATTFFAFIAGAALHRYLFDNEKHFLWLAGLTAGLTMATKYTAGPVVLPPLLLVLVVHAFRSKEKNFCGLIAFMALALAPLMPWLIKNAVFTGNPVYPFANALFQSPYWSEAQTELFHSRHAPRFETWEHWSSFLTLPWAISTRESFSSPILLLFAPLFLLVAGPQRRWKFCAWLAVLIYLCWWAFTFRPWRFLFPAMPWFALVGAIGIEVLQRERATGLLLRVSLLLMLVFNLNYMFILSAVDLVNPENVRPQVSKLAVFFGRISGGEYLSNVYNTLGWMSGNLPADAVVLWVGEARVYYARHRVLANTVYDKSIVGELVARSRTPEELLREMTSVGITHVYINQDELDRLGRNYDYLKDMNWPLFNTFLEQHARLIFQSANRAHRVYEIASNAQ